MMINSLNSMPKTTSKVSGSTGISILVANSLMFQRFPTHAGYDDPQLANFYGLALPFLKRGVPVKTVHLENLAVKNALAETKVLLMSYSNMKPLAPEAHQYLADWVKNGAYLYIVRRISIPFNPSRNGGIQMATNIKDHQIIYLKKWACGMGWLRRGNIATEKVLSMFCVQIPKNLLSSRTTVRNCWI
ncbi:hypothetical protein KUH03_32890 [Sphingobacterium sp. E70]|uniref:hypothetical protein n=1 Tax=Sphingobacterium sp. E70 TaxID=2853439 RepID=UPI00211CE188|nr:hypothetical protein [Sphingobacterium sp. E70]ULT23890.1 hypothetical protein KUH03_32890 [Sphingobacterium sp. E70]